MQITIEIPDEKLPDLIRVAARKLAMQSAGFSSLSPLESLASDVLQAAIEQRLELKEIAIETAPASRMRRSRAT